MPHSLFSSVIEDWTEDAFDASGECSIESYKSVRQNRLHRLSALLHDGCQMAKFTYAAIRGATFMQYPKRSQYNHAKKK